MGSDVTTFTLTFIQNSDFHPKFRFPFLSSISSTTTIALSFYSKLNREHLSLSLTQLLHIMGEKWIETLKAFNLSTDHKTCDGLLVKTADRSVSRQKWREGLTKLKNPKREADVWCPHLSFVWLSFLGSWARFSHAAPCCSYPLVCDLSGECSSVAPLP